MAEAVVKRSLDRFGKALVEEVRDKTIERLDMVLIGKMNSESAQKAHSALAGLDKKQLSAVKTLLADAVDKALFNLMFLLERDEEIDVAVRTSYGTVPSLREASDGLSGELWGDKGWIARFSKQRKPKLNI